MLIDMDSTQGERFQFFGSRIDTETGDVIYEAPAGDAWVTVRNVMPFYEERNLKREKKHEHVWNPKTRQMERITFVPDLSFEAAQKEREDAYDYALLDFEGFKNSKTGEVITCTRENKIALMKNPVFNRFIGKCQEILAGAGIKDKEEAEKN